MFFKHIRHGTIQGVQCKSRVIALSSSSKL